MQPASRKLEFRYLWEHHGKCLRMIFSNWDIHSPSQDMQHCLWTEWLQLDGGHRFLSQRTEPSRQTHTLHGSDASSHDSPLASSRLSNRQPASKVEHIETWSNDHRYSLFCDWTVMSEVFCCNGYCVLDPNLKTLCYSMLVSWKDLSICTFTGPAALLCDGVRTWSKDAGLALTVNRPIGAGTWLTAVSRMVETLSVSVWLLFIQTVQWRSWRNISGKNQLYDLALHQSCLFMLCSPRHKTNSRQSKKCTFCRRIYWPIK